MRISSAVFSGSASDAQKRPQLRLPEFAFIGRSNVGKSSLINSLCGNSSLAKTSSTPGKTRLINRFLVNGSFYIVDLPGYGFARVGRDERGKIQSLIDDYILESEDLTCLFTLLDSRHPLLPIDRDFINRLGQEGVPFAIILTKTDKLGSTALSHRVESLQESLLQDWEILPPILCSSARSGKGRDEILDYIDSILSDENTFKRNATQP